MLEEEAACCDGSVKTLILACSGGSNVGQIANAVMIHADKLGIGTAYCLAGIGADLSGFIESAKASRTILIDGCSVGCGRKTFEKNGITPSTYFTITGLGIEKKHSFDKLNEEIKETTSQIFPNI